MVAAHGAGKLKVARKNSANPNLSGSDWFCHLGAQMKLAWAARAARQSDDLY
jgi:hypothetical protein